MFDYDDVLPQLQHLFPVGYLIEFGGFLFYAISVSLNVIAQLLPRSAILAAINLKKLFFSNQKT